MASSRKSNLTDRVAARLVPLLPQHSHILIGLSGGMDSVVLLHLLHTLAPGYDWRLSALHVHHGISPNADAWVDYCTELCARHGIPLHIERVDISGLRDEHGIEAAARKLRHASFAKQLCDCVALAHHADDQAETLLLQLLRGAGIKGVAAMPLFKPATTQAHATVRPLLDIARGKLLEYAQQHSLQWVEDESNADDRYPRNFLRHRLLPLLEQRFPAYRDTLKRSARHFAEAGELLDELAQQDAQGVESSTTLELSLLRQLSRSRAKNLLRYWLHKQGAPMPQNVQLDELMNQLLDAREDAAVCFDFGNWQVQRYQDRAYVMQNLGAFDQTLVLPWHGEASLEWPALNSRLIFRQTQGQGISLSRLQSAPMTLRLRCGGETLRPHATAATRSMKNLLQEHHVPPWQRERLPLLYCGDELVSVVGVAVAAGFHAFDFEPGLVVEQAP
jgi:tRNA(Ile)-lysidine synthase